MMRVSTGLRLLLLLTLVSATACEEQGEPAAAGRAEPLTGAAPFIASGSVATVGRRTPASPVSTVSPSTDPREIECDGVDQDGDGADLCTPDADSDGVRASLDCDDSNARISPLAADTPCDGVDQNCNGFDECDADADGWQDRDDCDPRDPRIRNECRPAVPRPRWEL